MNAELLTLKRSMVKLHFLKAGLQTTVQDLGRFGQQHLGIPLNGVMDKRAAQLANELVGNTPDSPVLEITLLGPQIQFEGNCYIAITGANLNPSVSNKVVPLYQTFSVADEDILNFGKCVNGCRAYLAIGGSWQLPQWLGSYSASAIKDFTPASHMQQGSRIVIWEHSKVPEKIIPEPQRKAYEDDMDIEVIPGPEFEKIPRNVIAQFFGQSYTISPDSNRMGYRLREKIGNYKAITEVISSGIVPGTIQITNEGQPIILLADAQTTGGYPRIANVTFRDLDKLAQNKPGDAIRFCLKKTDDSNL